ncbi:MAG TPA: HEAT repeat domain-containing protein [Gaiellaceae bacterium]|nr:HEAT repeat domain-containing protein [Gaiellaceae bacterium]
MRRLPLPLLAVLLTTAVAPLWGDPIPAPPTAAINALSGLDFVPARSDLVRLLDGNVPSLIALANDDAGSDPGIRLRAYHALRQFLGDTEAMTGLRAAVARYRTARSGTELLYLVAAIDSLGEIGDASDLATLVPLLQATESRDLRAAVARALGSLGVRARVSDGCAALRTRTDPNVEPVPMVRSAANRALNRLATLCQ